MNRLTQREKVLALLKAKATVSNFELTKICLRYAARIHELRNDGHKITSTKVEGSEWHFSYEGKVAA